MIVDLESTGCCWRDEGGDAADPVYKRAAGTLKVCCGQNRVNPLDFLQRHDAILQPLWPQERAAAYHVEHGWHQAMVHAARTVKSPGQTPRPDLCCEQA